MRHKSPGGKAYRRSSWEFNRREFKRGCKVELEHTRNRRRACEIAMDHLVEDPRYYTKLAHVHPDSSSGLGFPRKSIRMRGYPINTRVFWTDPDDDLGSGPGVVVEHRGDVYTVLKDDGGEVECFVDELSYRLPRP